MTNIVTKRGAVGKVFTEHPDYKQYKSHFDLTHEAYFGVGGFLDGTALDKNIAETNEEYKLRKAQSYYVNRMKTYLQIIIDTIFGQDNFFRKVTGDYHLKSRSAFGDYQQTMKHAALLAQLYGGTSFVGLDRLKGEINTKADLQKNPLYLNVYSARKVPDWEQGEGNTFNWVKVLEPSLSRGSWDDPQDESELLRVWTPEEWFLYKDDNGKEVEVDNGKNAFGRVPIIAFQQQNPITGLLYSNVDSVQLGRIAKRMFNCESDIVLQLIYSCYNMLTVATPGGQPPSIETGVTRVLAFDSVAGTQPAWIAPSSETVNQLYKHLESLDEAFLKMLRMDKEGLKVITAAQTHYLTEQGSKSIRAFATQGEKLDRQLLEMACDFDGISNPEIEVTWPKDFTRNVLSSTTIDNFIKLNSIDNLAPTFKRDAQEDFIKQITPNLTPEKMAVYTHELNALLDEPAEPEPIMEETE